MEWVSSRECQWSRVVALLGVGLVVLQLICNVSERNVPSRPPLSLGWHLVCKAILEKMCEHELALHSGSASAQPPCQPPPARGRPRSGSLLTGATYRKEGCCNMPGARCNLMFTFVVWHSGLRSCGPRAGPAARLPGLGRDGSTQGPKNSRARSLFGLFGSLVPCEQGKVLKTRLSAGH